VIAFAGMPGSGKGVAVSVAQEKGFPIVTMGDIVRQWVKDIGLELTDANVGRVATEERKKHGYDIWAIRTMEKVRTYTGSAQGVVIDGTRGEAEVNVFRKHFRPEFGVIAIHASPKTRFERILRRRRADDVLTEEAFHERDDRELSWGLGNVIAKADVMIVNEGSIEEFKRSVDEAINRIIRESMSWEEAV